MVTELETLMSQCTVFPIEMKSAEKQKSETGELIFFPEFNFMFSVPYNLWRSGFHFFISSGNTDHNFVPSFPKALIKILLLRRNQHFRFSSYLKMLVFFHFRAYCLN